MIAAMLRSASARRRFGADASVFVFVLVIGSVDGHRLRVEPQLREEVLRARENRQCHHAGEASDEGGDQERVARFPDAACGPRIAPLDPAAIVEKIAMPSVPPIS